MEVVLDTNVIISAAISLKGPPARIVQAWRAGFFSWVLSPALLAELERAFSYPRVRRHMTWNEREVQEFLGVVRQAAVLVTPTDAIDVVQDDPDDNRVLEAAVAGGAEFTVTGNQDLLRLQSYEGIEIISPARFAAVLSSSLP